MAARKRAAIMSYLMGEDASCSIRLFGGLRVCGAGQEIDRWPTRRSALLLARLALSRSGSIGRDELAETLWPDDFLDATRLRLRQELNRLRAALGPFADVLLADRSWVRIDLEQAEVDSREFDRLLTLAKSCHSQADAAKYRESALAIFTGPLLAEYQEDWVQAERQEAHAKFMRAIIEQAEALLQAGEGRESLAFALRAIRSDPHHEPARLAAIQAFAEMGDVAGALRQYQEFERVLSREYGARPSESLQQLAEEIRSRSSAAPGPGATEPARKNGEHSPNLAPLPAYLDRMIGRETELGLLAGWLETASPVRLATITGPGGVGKTRLALEAAKIATHGFEGSVIFVSLADTEPGQGVASRIQDAFGVSGHLGSQEPIPGLGSRRCLIVLDNAEHLIEEARQAAKDLLIAHPGAVLLATSRQRLGIGGEQELPLSPLNLPDIAGGVDRIVGSPAAELFLERARAVRPEYGIQEDQAEPLAMLLERLDGLPLSIELAAARVGLLTPEQMLGEIDDRFTFLVSRRKDVGPRQRSLRATIDWSFRLLDDELRSALGMLATFRGGWTIELARRAFELEDTVGVLHELAERSLIFRDEEPGGPRFGMLEAIREYVLDAVPEDVRQANRERHAKVIAEYVFEVSRELIGDRQDASYNALRLEMDNARAAVEWAEEHGGDVAGTLGAGLWRYWCGKGPREGSALLGRLLKNCPPQPNRRWAESMLGRGILADGMSDYEAGREWEMRAAETYRSLDLPMMTSWAEMNLAFTLLELGATEEALQAGIRSLEAPTEYNRPLILHSLAAAQARLGRYEEAMKAAEQSFALDFNISDKAKVARAYYLLAEVYADCGKYDAVRGLLQESVERLRETHVGDFLLKGLMLLATEELRLGNGDSFLSVLEEAKELASEFGQVRTLSALAALEARLACDEGRWADGARCYSTAVRLAGDSNSTPAVLRVGRMLAHDLARRGKTEPATEVLAGEAVLRKQIGCGLSWPEQDELDRTLALLDGAEFPESAYTMSQLSVRMLALSLALT